MCAARARGLDDPDNCAAVHVPSEVVIDHESGEAEDALTRLKSFAARLAAEIMWRTSLSSSVRIIAAP